MLFNPEILRKAMNPQGVNAFIRILQAADIGKLDDVRGPGAIGGSYQQPIASTTSSNGIEAQPEEAKGAGGAGNAIFGAGAGEPFSVAIAQIGRMLETGGFLKTLMSGLEG